MCKKEKIRDFEKFKELVTSNPKKLSDEDLVWSIKQCIGPYLVTEQKHFEAELIYRYNKAMNRHNRIMIFLAIILTILTAMMVLKMFLPSAFAQ